MAAGYGLANSGIAVWRTIAGDASEEDQIVTVLVGMLIFCVPLWFFAHRKFIARNMDSVLAAAVALMAGAPIVLYLLREDTRLGKMMNDAHSIGGFVGKVLLNGLALFLFWLFCCGLFYAARGTFRALFADKRF